MAVAEYRHSPALRALDYVFILRPTVAVGMWVFFLSGAALASRAGGIRFSLLYPSGQVLLGLTVSTLVLGGGLLLNQIVDVESDRVNNKLFFLPRGLITIRAAWAELVLVWALAALLSTLLSPHFRFVAAAALVVNVTYSAPPVRAKSRFPLDLIWNALGFGFASVAAGWASVTPLTSAVVPLGLTYGLAVAGVTASAAIPDLEGDRRSGLATTAAVLGEHSTSLLATILVSAAALCGAVLRDPVSFFGSVASLPLFVRAHFTWARMHRIAANQLMVAVFAIVVSIRAPYMLALLAVVYFGSRAYYRARFGLSYPGTGTP
ncbi:MAG: UbiA family prenyltransferase [Candidatus Eisenbacteria bacterium]|nr:UbiA family prenyltransferase [Candidatus Eisenbacteria bacterium]